MNSHLRSIFLASLVWAASLGGWAHPGGPDTGNRPASSDDRRPHPPFFEDQVAQGYQSLVRMLSLQITHAHDPATRAQGLQQVPPAEVWYVATVKPVDRAGLEWRYCVAPRLELPGNTEWAPHVKVMLLGSEKPGQQRTLLAEVETSALLPAGASVELASSGKWCVLRSLKGPDSPPEQYLATAHGSRKVAYPKLNAASIARGWPDGNTPPEGSPPASAAEPAHPHPHRRAGPKP